MNISKAPLKAFPEMFEQYSLDNDSSDWQYLEYPSDYEGYSVTRHIQDFIANAFLMRFLEAMLSVCGLFGNGVTIMILVSHGLQDATNILLTSIAVCDQIYLSDTFFFELHRILVRIDPRAAKEFAYFHYRVFVRITNLSLICNICQVAVISVERVTAVLFPFAVSRIFTPYRVKCLIVLVLIYVFAVMFPTFFLIRDQSDIDMSDGRLKLFLIIPNTFVYLIPLSIILISNVAIALKLHLSSTSALHQSSSGREAKKQKELKLFKMLFVVCCVAFCAFSPRIVIAFVFVSDPEHPLVTSDNIRLLFATLFHAYASSNFVIYVTMSSKFANTYRRILCGLY